MRSEKEIIGLYIEPNQYPRIIKIINELSAFQKAVNGYIECIDLPNGATIICNEEGKINGELLNRIIFDANGEIVDVVAGNMVIVGFNADDGEFTSLTPEQYEEVKQQFFYPDIFFKINDKLHMVNISWLMNFSDNTGITFTDRKNGETKHKIACTDEFEQIKLFAFVNRMKSNILEKLEQNTSILDMTDNNKDFNFCTDMEEER